MRKIDCLKACLKDWLESDISEEEMRRRTKMLLRDDYSEYDLTLEVGTGNKLQPVLVKDKETEQVLDTFLTMDHLYDHIAEEYAAEDFVNDNYSNGYIA